MKRTVSSVNRSPRKIFLYVVVPAVHCPESFMCSTPGIVLESMRDTFKERKKLKSFDAFVSVIRENFDEWNKLLKEPTTVKIGVMSMDWGWNGDEQEAEHLQR